MAYTTGYEGQLNAAQNVVIANAGTASAAIDCGGFTLVGIKIPAAFTGIALTFTMCDTIDGTYVPVKVTTSGTALSYTVAPGGYYAIDPKDFYGIRYLKIVSGSSEAAERTLVCSLKGI